MRQRASLPSYVRLETEGDGGTLAFLCPCGEAEAIEVRVRLEEDGSSAEVRCAKCGRYVQVRASWER